MKLYLIICILLFLASCSRIDVAVSLAPRFIANSIDDALDLDSDRYKKIKNTIAADIVKNKGPLFTEIISKIDHLMLLTEKKELTPEDLRFLFYEFKELQKRAVYAFKPSFSEVILPITRGEIKEFKSYQNEKNEKQNETFSDRKKYLRHFFKSYDHYVELLFDTGNREQEALYREFLDLNLDYFKMRSQSRFTGNLQFEILYEKKTELLDYNLRFYAGEATTKSEEFIKRQDSFNNSMLNFGGRFWGLTSLAQKNHFRKYLSDLKEELKKLITKE